MLFERLTKNEDGSFLTREESEDESEGGCLAGPVGPQKTVDGSLGNGEVDSPQDRIGGEPVGESLDCDCLRCHAAGLRDARAVPRGESANGAVPSATRPFSPSNRHAMLAATPR